MLAPFEPTKQEELSVKELAVLAWACGKLRVPQGHGLPLKLRSLATNIIADCTINEFHFNWNHRGDPVRDHLTSEIEGMSAHAVDDLHE